MANIRTESNRHRWTYRPLPGLPGAHEAKKYGEAKRGYFCTNCRSAWDPERGDPPVSGCLLDQDAMKLGRSRLDDLSQQERRLMDAQNARERAEDIRAGACRPDGTPITE